MARSKTDKLWIFWIETKDHYQLVVSTFFGRLPQKSNAYKEYRKRFREESVIRGGWSNDTINYVYYTWPDNVVKPLEVEEYLKNRFN